MLFSINQIISNSKSLTFPKRITVLSHFYYKSSINICHLKPTSLSAQNSHSTSNHVSLNRSCLSLPARIRFHIIRFNLKGVFTFPHIHSLVSTLAHGYVSTKSFSEQNKKAYPVPTLPFNDRNRISP